MVLEDVTEYEKNEDGQTVEQKLDRLLLNGNSICLVSRNGGVMFTH